MLIKTVFADLLSFYPAGEQRNESALPEGMMQEQLLNCLVESPVVGIEVTSTDGRILSTNTTYRNLLGFTEAELAAMTRADLCPGSEADGLQRLLAGDCDHLMRRIAYRTKTGQQIWCDCTINLAPATGGGDPVLVTFLVDATRRQRQEALQLGRTRVLELLYRSRPLSEVCTVLVEAIEAVEPGLLCSILRLNPTTGRLHKLAAPHLPGFYNDAIEGMRIGDGVGSCGTAAYTGERVIVGNILEHPYWQRVRCLIEKTQLRSCWSQPIFDSAGQVLGTFAIYYTEPREPGEFELELIDSAADLAALAINHTQALAALEKRDQLKNEFISIAAHELNTPLATILGYVDLMRLSQDKGTLSIDKRREYLDVIGGKVDSLSRIVNDLLDISKIEGGYSLVLDRRPTPLRKLLEGVVDQFRKNAPGHSFSLKIEGEVPELVVLDADRIVQVMENLLGNAVKYSPQGGLIGIAASARGERWRLVVSDQGIGMSSEQLERIFEKFYRAVNADTSIRGLGLGMSIVREIVEAHQGEIRVASTPGQGTRVTLDLPVN